MLIVAKLFSQKFSSALLDGLKSKLRLVGFQVGSSEPLVCTDKNKIDKAMHIKMRQDLSNPEKSTLYVCEISGCKGLEFVGFSNAKNVESVNVLSAA